MFLAASPFSLTIVLIRHFTDETHDRKVVALEVNPVLAMVQPDELLQTLVVDLYEAHLRIARCGFIR